MSIAPLVANAVVGILLVIPFLQVAIMVILVKQDNDVPVLIREWDGRYNLTLPFSVTSFYPTGVNVVAVLVHIGITAVVEAALPFEGQ
jgi:hypothetical protein